jgi:hypothetical protein
MDGFGTPTVLQAEGSGDHSVVDHLQSYHSLGSFVSRSGGAFLHPIDRPTDGPYSHYLCFIMEAHGSAGLTVPFEGVKNGRQKRVNRPTTFRVFQTEHHKGSIKKCLKMALFFLKKGCCGA